MRRSISFIRNRDDIASKVGHLVADYAHLEFLLAIIYALVSQDEPATSFSEFYAQRSANRKCGLILRVAQPISVPDAFSLLRRICRRFKGAASKRTEVAHCVFMAPNGRLSRLRVFEEIPDFAPVDDELFSRATEQFRELSIDLRTSIVFLSPAPARLREVLQAIPRPPGMDPNWDTRVRARSRTEDEMADRRASLARLKLTDWDE